LSIEIPAAPIPEGLKVTVDEGWVTLKGEVDWEYQRTAARDVVSQLMGVCGVTNEITLAPRVLPSDVKSRIKESLERSADSDANNPYPGVFILCLSSKTSGCTRD